MDCSCENLTLHMILLKRILNNTYYTRRFQDENRNGK